jgi:hypothetical protein
MGTPYSAAATRTPAPQIRAGLVGMIADEVEHSVTTRLCETTAGIGFGLAVSQGTGDKGCILGGSAFIGVTVRDIALSLSPVDPLTADGSYNTSSVYPPVSFPMRVDTLRISAVSSTVWSLFTDRPDEPVPDRAGTFEILRVILRAHPLSE